MIPPQLNLFSVECCSDIIYNPVKTKLLQVAEKKGCKIVNGLGTLVYQGAEGFKLWTGAEPPVEAMFTAVRTLLRS